MNSFDKLSLLAPIQESMHKQGFSTPTPIQVRAIPPILQGRDVLGCAQTGSGKTAAFLLPILQFLYPLPPAPKREPYALIIAPTRELALQINSQCTLLSEHLSTTNNVLFGGIPLEEQIEILQHSVDIVIATPGRLLDLIAKQHLNISSTSLFVLDEVDRMLDMGFLPDIKRLSALLPEKKQSLFFSATLSPHITKLASRILHKPIFIETQPQKIAHHIPQTVMFVEEQNKFHLLLSLLKEHPAPSIVFTKTKKTAEQLSLLLQKKGIFAISIHGDKSQRERMEALLQCKNKECSVLVATDIAARGIDFEHIEYVFNHNIPATPETYVHRIGRTGRAGKKGCSFSLCDTAETKDLTKIESYTQRLLLDDVEHTWHCPQAFRQAIIHRTEIQQEQKRARSIKKKRTKRLRRRR